MSHDGPRYSGLADYLGLLRRHWLLILLPTVLAAGVAYTLSKRETTVYQADAALLIQDETRQLELLGTSVAPNTAPGSSPVVVAETANTPALAAQVRRRLHTRIPAEALRGAVGLTYDPNTGLVKVLAVASRATSAMRIANAFADQIAASTNASARSQFGEAVRTLRQRLRALSPTNPADAAERATLIDEINRLEFLQTNSVPGRVVTRAELPSGPTSPQPKRDAALGALGGLLVGLILAFVKDALDRRIRGTAEIHRALGLPVIGQLRTGALGHVVRPDDDARGDTPGDIESFRMMRRRVEHLRGDGGPTVLVTSPVPEEGKSTVAASVALAAAAAGRRTLLIDADMRRPSLSERLGLPSSPGLHEYLVGEAGSQDILQISAVTVPAAPAMNGHAPETNSNGHHDQLVFIAAGTPTSRSTELLASDRMQGLLDGVSQSYDLVVIDSPPLLPVADGLELLPKVSGVVLCVRAGRTTRDQAQASRDLLADLTPERIGVVVTGLSTSRAADDGLYPYRYSTAGKVKSPA